MIGRREEIKESEIETLRAAGGRIQYYKQDRMKEAKKDEKKETAKVGGREKKT
jgi:hypothetical protein